MTAIVLPAVVGTTDPAAATGTARPAMIASFNKLTGVYCTSGTFCLAVGLRQTTTGASVNQVLRWNGSTWRPVRVPLPGGTTGNAFSSLQSVRCLTARDCWAVGSYRKGDADLDEALHWNGTKWTLTPTPTPGGILSGATNELNDVVCASGADCWAVGLFGTAGMVDANQALHWNGTRWSLVSTPDPGGTSAGGNNVLNAIRCSSRSECLAIGYYGTQENFRAVTSLVSLHLSNEALRWNGKKWTTMATPNPGGTADGDNNELNGLACSSATSCWAAGDTGTVNSPLYTLNQILHWNGHRWSSATVPDPGGTTAAQNDLYWDACVSTTDCWAVGQEGPVNGNSLLGANQALHWNGAKWSVVTTPNPARTAQRGLNILFAVRCTVASDCWAVGEQQEFPNIDDQILHWNGKKWVSADSKIR